MAGEEGSSKARTTRSGSKRAAKAAVSGGEEQRCPAAEESVRITRSKAAVIGSSELKQGAAAAKGDEQEAPAKKKGRLPQEEVNRILARVQDNDLLPRAVVDLKRRNPDLIPSREEEMDEEMMDLYQEARLTYHVRERFPEFQAWVRREYQKNGYVEVEEGILVRLEDTKKAWEEGLKAHLIRRNNLMQSKPHA